MRDAAGLGVKGGPRKRGTQEERKGTNGVGEGLRNQLHGLPLVQSGLDLSPPSVLLKSTP